MLTCAILGWAFSGWLALWLYPPFERWDGAYLVVGIMAATLGPLLLPNAISQRGG